MNQRIQEILDRTLLVAGGNEIASKAIITAITESAFWGARAMQASCMEICLEENSRKAIEKRILGLDAHEVSK